MSPVNGVDGIDLEPRRYLDGAPRPVPHPMAIHACSRGSRSYLGDPGPATERAWSLSVQRAGI